MQPNYGRLVSSFYRDNSFDLSFGKHDDAALSARNAVPTISVTASIPTAHEAGPVAGLFTLQRFGDTSTIFNVTIGLSGTARIGINFISVPLLVPFAVGQVLASVLITPILGGLGSSPSATVIMTAVPDGNSNYYAAFTAVPIGPLSSTDFNITLNNSATITILP